MNTWKKMVVIGCLLALMLPAYGCSDDGSMESAGRKMDQMVQDAEDSMNDAVSKTKRKLGIHEPGPAEKLLGESGRSIDEFIWKAEEVFDDLMADAKGFLTDVK